MHVLQLSLVLQRAWQCACDALQQLKAMHGEQWTVMELDATCLLCIVTCNSLR